MLAAGLAQRNLLAHQDQACAPAGRRCGTGGSEPWKACGRDLLERYHAGFDRASLTWEWSSEAACADGQGQEVPLGGSGIGAEVIDKVLREEAAEDGVFASSQSTE